MYDEHRITIMPKIHCKNNCEWTVTLTQSVQDNLSLFTLFILNIWLQIYSVIIIEAENVNAYNSQNINEHEASCYHPLFPLSHDILVLYGQSGHIFPLPLEPAV